MTKTINDTQPRSAVTLISPRGERGELDVQVAGYRAYRLEDIWGDDPVMPDKQQRSNPVDTAAVTDAPTERAQSVAASADVPVLPWIQRLLFWLDGKASLHPAMSPDGLTDKIPADCKSW